MAMQASRKPPRIITIVAKKLGGILADYLSNPTLLGQRIPLKDRLTVKIMLSLNKKFYRRELLFRDYSQKASDLLIDYVMPSGHIEKLHIESIYYTEEILSRRLTIVSKQKSLPSNMHMLLLMLCRYNLNDCWQRTKIKRRHTEPSVTDPFFKKTETIAKKQCKKLIKVSAVSETYRKKYGCFQLVSGRNSAELIEEISLFDLIEVMPLPLKPEITSQSTWFVPLIERIVSSLNENYGLLRSCGLPPQEWRGALSIGKLRDLKLLKKTTDSLLKTGQQRELNLAYQQAFLEIQVHKTKNPNKLAKLAGFYDFIEFSHSKVGTALLKTEFNSFEDNGKESHSFAETLAAEDDCSSEMDSALKKLLTDYSDNFTPLTAYFFEYVLVLQYPLYGDKGLFNDLQFRRLVAADENYATMEEEKLVDKIIQKIKLIMQKHVPLNDFVP
ncbi:MAG: hypothetical protein KAU26_08590 [Methylococcales bacterium]|nr:hypothetical protein [Methylococcales bacterium]